MKSQLLCTFTSTDYLDGVLQSIRESYSLLYNYIYVLQNKENLDELYITYNINTNYVPDNPLRDTILVHRKKETNTIYTINALNHLIREENNGMIDPNYVLNWNKYRNSIILTNTFGYKQIKTRVFDIIEFDEN